MVEEQYRVWREDVLPSLAAAGIYVVERDALSSEQKQAAHEHFLSAVFPALTPLAVDPGHPFPHLRNKTLNIAVLLRKEGRRRRREQPEDSLAVVQVPALAERLVPLPSSEGKSFILLTDLIALHMGELFPGWATRQTATFRVTRNWDLDIDEEESDDLLSTVEEELLRRERGAAVRLELEAGATEEIERRLLSALRLASSDVYRAGGPIELSGLRALADTDPRPELRVEPLVPRVPPVLNDGESMFAVVAARDVLLHHPYESFDPVLRLLQEAADDPDVLAIKQTLYRTSGDSPIARVLARAAENGKQVAVLVEIKARFDEPNNIIWARKLEESGVHVVYGLVGLKTHCKVVLIARREGGKIRRYVHIGTGNYNPVTARQYTDLSLFTAREDLAADVTLLFNLLTGYSEARQWKKLAVAPFGLHERIVALIKQEEERARRGEPARIVAKMNSLVDAATIRALYSASQAGVEIDLLVRGICCLRPGLPGVSERIRVTSIVDRFLEHSRAFAFGTGDKTEVYISSADWMPRNFIRRIEVMAPVDDPVIRARLLDEVLGSALRDNVKARRLKSDGTYEPVPPVEPAVRSQTLLLDTVRRVAEPPPPGETVLRHVAAPQVTALPVGPTSTPQVAAPQVEAEVGRMVALGATQKS
jgi:polyphosphate kinase